jgi:hypothetical protein
MVFHQTQAQVLDYLGFNKGMFFTFVAFYSSVRPPQPGHRAAGESHSKE